jgi:hypothetical protein
MMSFAPPSYEAVNWHIETSSIFVGDTIQLGGRTPASRSAVAIVTLVHNKRRAKAFIRICVSRDNQTDHRVDQIAVSAICPAATNNADGSLAATQGAERQLRAEHNEHANPSADRYTG